VIQKNATTKRNKPHAQTQQTNLAGDRAREVRLARPGGPLEDDAARRARADAHVSGVAQQHLDDLAHLKH
jgi:hypothetical protein